MRLSIRIKKSFVFLVLYLLLSQDIKAQYDDSAFVRYTFKDGLTADYITCLEQDDRGYMWIGTDDGLNRFDGNSFSNYRQHAHDLPLASGRITSLSKLGPHRLAIISRGGLQVLSTDRFSLHPFLIPDSTAFSTYLNDGRAAALLSDQEVSLSTATGFYVFDNSGKLLFRHDAFNAANTGNRIPQYGSKIFPIDQRVCLVYSGEYGAALYDPEKKTYRETDTTDTAWQIFKMPPSATVHFWINKFQLNPHEFIFTLSEKDSITWFDRLQNRHVSSALPFHTKKELDWASTLTKINDSLFAITSATTGFYLLTIHRASGLITCEAKKFMSGYTINCILLDKDKRLWLGTETGLLAQKLSPSFLIMRDYGSSADDLESFTCIYRHRDKLYAGSVGHFGGLLILDTSGMKVVKRVRFFNDDQHYNEVRSIEMYHPDTLWLGTYGGLLWYDTRSGHYGKVPGAPGAGSPGAILLAPPRADGSAWFCRFLEGMAGRYDIRNRKFTVYSAASDPTLPFKKVKSIAYDSYGDVWIGGHGLARWNTKKGLFDTLISVYGGLNKFNDDILTFSADDHGSLWLHNAENGLLQYNIAERKFIPYTVDDGLPSSSFTAFSPVVNDQLWMSSANSLSCFNVVTKKTITYDYRDGFSGQTSYSRKIYYDTERKQFYLAARNKVGTFSLQPQLYLGNYGIIVEKMAAGNKKTLFFPDTTVVLAHDENDLSLYVSLVDLEPGNNFNFAYRMNHQSEWNWLGRQRNIYLPGLLPGNYSLELKAIDRLGREKLSAFTFAISPPFWKTSWFLVLCMCAAAGILYYLYRMHIRRVKQKANIDKLLAQTEMKALHAQMNPHFIFNSLNSIREMILHSENKEASQYLAKFAQLIRMTLDQSSQPFITLHSTIDYLKAYVEMEKTRNTFFSFNLTVDSALDPDEILLPPMLIQPFIENAIWHGRGANQQRIDISLSFKQQGSRLLCLIEDNGIGINQSKKDKGGSNGEGPHSHNPVGISNIQRRVCLLNEKYNLEGSLIIEDKSESRRPTDHGTRVTLFLSLQTNAEWIE